MYNREEKFKIMNIYPRSSKSEDAKKGRKSSCPDAWGSADIDFNLD